MKERLSSLGNDVQIVSIDIVPNESPIVVKRYADQNGFGWRFAVAPAPMLRDLPIVFGTRFLDTTSVPMFVVDHIGRPHLAAWGRKDPKALSRLVDTYRSG